MRKIMRSLAHTTKNLREFDPESRRGTKRKPAVMIFYLLCRFRVLEVLGAEKLGGLLEIEVKASLKQLQGTQNKRKSKLLHVSLQVEIISEIQAPFAHLISLLIFKFLCVLSSHACRPWSHGRCPSRATAHKELMFQTPIETLRNEPLDRGTRPGVLNLPKLN
jgi:hypothetical protein